MHLGIIKLLIAKQKRIEYPVILCKARHQGILSVYEGPKDEKTILVQINPKNKETILLS